MFYNIFLTVPYIIPTYFLAWVGTNITIWAKQKNGIKKEEINPKTKMGKPPKTFPLTIKGEEVTGRLVVYADLTSERELMKTSLRSVYAMDVDYYFKTVDFGEYRGLYKVPKRAVD